MPDICLALCGDTRKETRRNLHDPEEQAFEILGIAYCEKTDLHLTSLRNVEGDDPSYILGIVRGNWRRYR